MRKTVNKEKICGRLYDISDLKISKVQNTESAHYGEEFIGGSIDIATDDDCLNIVTVHFTFVQATYSSGKTNNTYGVLKNLIDSGKSVLTDGKDSATMVSIDAALGLNDFYTSRNGEETLVSAKRNMGSFANIVSKLPNEDSRSTFECDMLINGTRYIEANEEKNIKEHALISGGIFNFRNELLPVELVVYNPKAIAYFESMGISNKNPLFTEIKGTQVSTTIISRKEEEGAFGEVSVSETRSTRKEYVVTWAKGTPYAWDDESTITAEELKEAMAARETYLAGIKKRQEEYQANRKKANVATSGSGSANDGYDF
jgi:hypothetical protein